MKYFDESFVSLLPDSATAETAQVGVCWVLNSQPGILKSITFTVQCSVVNANPFQEKHLNIFRESNVFVILTDVNYFL